MTVVYWRNTTDGCNGIYGLILFLTERRCQGVACSVISIDNLSFEGNHLSCPSLYTELSGSLYHFSRLQEKSESDTANTLIPKSSLVKKAKLLFFFRLILFSSDLMTSGLSLGHTAGRLSIIYGLSNILFHIFS
jgi:hypothetical protein